MEQLFVGVDIAKLKYDVALLLENRVEVKAFDNNPTGHAKLLKWIQQQQAQQVHVCMEATGPYGESLAAFLYEKAIKVSVVNPTQIKSFRQVKLMRTKTDQADAKLIAQFCQSEQPVGWKPQPPHIVQLRAWVSQLQSLQSMRQQQVNRLQVCHESLHGVIQKSIAHFDKQIVEVKAAIKQQIREQSDLHEKSQLLASIPGIGQATTEVILSFLPQVKEFRHAKQAAAFGGLNPRQCRSGTSVHGRSCLSKVGNPILRKAFYMPALVAKRHNPVIKAFAERLERAGKSKMVIIGAIMRKLMHIVYGVLKSGQPFNPHFSTQSY